MERGEEPSRKVDRGMEGKALSRESPRFVFSTIFAVLSLAVLYKPIDIFFTFPCRLSALVVWLRFELYKLRVPVHVTSFDLSRAIQNVSSSLERCGVTMNAISHFLQR